MPNLLDTLKERIVVFDGAMGTNLQVQNLSLDDFGGPRFEGCNENLLVTRPDAVEKVHAGFLDVGCDVVETNSFNGTPVDFAEYDIADKAYDMNVLAAQLAKRVASDYSTKDKPRWVAGSMGPGRKLPTLGHISFTDLRDAYAVQARGLLDGGVDLLIVETCQDLLQTKAALAAIFAHFQRVASSRACHRTGHDRSVWDHAQRHRDLRRANRSRAFSDRRRRHELRHWSKAHDREYSLHLRKLAAAGLRASERRFAFSRRRQDALRRDAGNFHGPTGPLRERLRREHRRWLLWNHTGASSSRRRSDAAITPKQRHAKTLPAASSIYIQQPYVQDASFLIVGERVNASGSKKMRDLLNAEDWDGLVALGKEQEREGAHILDVNVDFVGRDGEHDMHELASRLVTNVKIPLMFDSTEWQKMEAGLQHAGGKCILNSTNYEDGVPRFVKVIELAKTYGASVVIGTIDEDGMARTSEGKLKIATACLRTGDERARSCPRLTSSSIRSRCRSRPVSKKTAVTHSKRSRRSGKSKPSCRARSRFSACRTSLSV